jgi:hypothetical protein
MTELTDVDDGMTTDVSVAMWPRTVHRTALRPATSRRELHTTARAEARHTRGRNAFIWRGRMIPLGVPLAAGAGLFAWRRRGSSREALGVALAVAALGYLEARAEWSVRRRAYRRRHDIE